MKQSESIAKLAGALVLVQEHLEPITKDASNPHFGSSFASLDHIMETVRPILAGRGLAIVQGGAGPVSDANGTINGVSVETMLVHEAGEWVSSIIVLPLSKATAQEVGSAITYGRRYGVSALLALSTEEDDDGQRASAGDRQTGNAARPTTPTRTATAATAATTTTSGQTSSQSSTTSGEPCPKCGGPCYDNRAENDQRAAEGKKLRPDWACKNAPKERGGVGCSGVIWRAD